MSNAEFGFLASLMSDENLKTSVEGFIVDAQKMRQPAAISLPLLKVASTLLIALVAMPKADGRLLISLFHDSSQNPDGRGFYADVCHPDELSVQHIAGLIEKGYRALMMQYPPEAEVSSEIIILHQVLHFILQQLGSSTTFTQHSEPSSGSA